MLVNGYGATVVDGFSTTLVMGTTTVLVVRYVVFPSPTLELVQYAVAA